MDSTLFRVTPRRAIGLTVLAAIVLALDSLYRRPPDQRAPPKRKQGSLRPHANSATAPRVVSANGPATNTVVQLSAASRPARPAPAVAAPPPVGILRVRPAAGNRSSQPWNYPPFAGAISKRARDQFTMRKNSGFYGRDSPFPEWLRGTEPSAAAGPAPPAVLTGTAWHYGPGRHAAAAAACAAHGVWSAPLGRCDCGPYRWGATCAVPVVPVPRPSMYVCVMNDSAPWCSSEGGRRGAPAHTLDDASSPP